MKLEEIVDIVFKKISYGVSRTLGAVNPFEEAYSSPIVVASEDVWAETKKIVYNNPSATPTGIIESKQVVATKANSDGKAWATLDSNNNQVITKWLNPAKYGQSYGARVFVTSSLGKNELDRFASSYYFDYDAGVLHFSNGIVPPELQAVLDSEPENFDNSVIIEGYRYIGEIGVAPPSVQEYVVNIQDFIDVEDNILVLGSTSGSQQTTGMQVSNTLQLNSDSFTQQSGSVLFDEFDATKYRTIKYYVLIEDQIDSRYLSSEILVIHDDNVANVVEYATVSTETNQSERLFADFSANYIANSQNIQVIANVNSTNYTLKFSTISLV